MGKRGRRVPRAGAFGGRFGAATVCLAGRNRSWRPLHRPGVGRKGDPAAQELFRSAARYPSSYKRLEWWDDSSDGPLPNPDVKYPQLSKAALFICTNRTCSAPIFQASELKNKDDRLSAADSAGAVLRTKN